MVAFVERIGKPVTEATGLTASRFDYVKSTMSEKQLAKAQKTASERKLRNEASRRAVEVEEGGGPPISDFADDRNQSTECRAQD